MCRQSADVVRSSAAPDVTNDAVARRSKHRQRLPPTAQSVTPDVASVASPVSAIERLDNLIKVAKRLLIDRLEYCLQCFDAVGWAAGRASDL